MNADSPILGRGGDNKMAEGDKASPSLSPQLKQAQQTTKELKEKKTEEQKKPTVLILSSKFI